MRLIPRPPAGGRDAWQRVREMNRKIGRSIQVILTGAALAALAGCSAGDRAKALYLHQYKTLSALTTAIDAVEPNDPDLADRLYDTEDELQAVCAALMEAGVRRFNAREIGGALKWRVFQELDECERKTYEVERMRWAVDPESAGRYLIPRSVDNDP